VKRVGILGGGPGGLYAGILLKKSFPDCAVDVWERNAADDTFGWGVVFSEETLFNLEEADPETYAEMAATFAHWDCIDTWHKGCVIRSCGHGFVGIGRQKLLNILQARAELLGVRLHYKTEVNDLSRFSDCDLLVAADGINSMVRRMYADHFLPSIDKRKCKFIWLGTKLKLPAFTFFLKANEHGFFQVHAYQFDSETSTFIVECDEQSWRNAGLDKATTDETVAYLENLYAEELQGHRLLTNKSEWINFRTIKNEHWFHENIVLLGDATHTAHYSIGSGTKLAMEDAICLDLMLREKDSLPEALQGYETERKWYTDKLQGAAQVSLEWFEDLWRRQDYDPDELMYSMMTRSRRLVHDQLHVRDEGYVKGVNKWFAERAGVEFEGDAPTPMFTPFKLRGLTLENRVAVSPMCMYSAEDGVVNDWHLVHIGSRAVGGAGLVLTEMTDVSAEARISPGCAGMYKPEHVAAWKRIVDFVHERSGAKIGMQLAHAGRKGATKLMWEGIDQPLDDGAWEIVAPSPVPYLKHSQVPKALDRAGMDAIKADFVRAAGMANEAGFDMLEIHLAHGYLLGTFLSPLSNRREDEYGGPIENRMRFPLEIFLAVRAAWPADKPMSVRVSAIDWKEGGQTIEDTIAVCRALKEAGCDIVDVSSGHTDADEDPELGRCYQVPFSERIRKEVEIPTMAVGAIGNAGAVNSILASGQADLCALARPHLFDPYFTLHAAAAQEQHQQHWPPQYIAAKPEPRDKLPWLEREKKKRRR
jgi:anthraniloyl-CoA monooxygenase